MALVTFPRQFLVNSSGVPRVGAKATFYAAGTTTEITTYTTPAYSVAHANPVLSVAGGLFPAVYVNPSVNETYKLVITDSADVALYTEDNIPTLGSQAEPFYGTATEETAATVTPSDKTYPVLNVLRYGADPTGVSDSSAAIQAAIDVAEQYDSDGNGGGAIVYLPTGSYNLLTGLTITSTNFISIRGDGKFNSNLFPEGGITALTVKSRSLFADFGIVGESKTDNNTGIACTSVAKPYFRNVRARRLENGAVLTDCWISQWDNPEFDGCANALVLVGDTDVGFGSGSFRCQNNRFFGGSWANNDYAIRLQGARNTVFFGPNIELNQYGVVMEGQACLANHVTGAWVERTHIPWLFDISDTGAVTLNNTWEKSYISINGVDDDLPGTDTLADSRFLKVADDGNGIRNTVMRDNYIVLGSGATTTIGIEVDTGKTIQFTKLDNNFWPSTLTYSADAGNELLGMDGDNLAVIHHTETIDFGSIGTGAEAASSFTVTGAVVGAFVEVAPSATLSDLTFSAYVPSANAVRIVVANNTGGAVNLPSLDWRVIVRNHDSLGF